MTVATETGITPELAKLEQYRVTAWQPKSFSLDRSAPFRIQIQGEACEIFVQPQRGTPEGQMTHGGSFVHIAFALEEGVDLVAAGGAGVDAIEDFLSAISLVDGINFGTSELVQASRLTNDGRCETLQILDLMVGHWKSPVTDETLMFASHLVAHWDNLEKGSRLRRSARAFRRAVGENDALTAFQNAYTGLEALEPILAPIFGLTPGSERVHGECEHCKTAFVRNRTALVGVRAFVLDSHDSNTADPSRKSDWRKMNSLRNDATHGLKDYAHVLERAGESLPAVMHYLHDAVCNASHCSELVAARFRIAREEKKFAIHSIYDASSDTYGPLSTWGLENKILPGEWVEHAQYGHVPQFSWLGDGRERPNGGWRPLVFLGADTRNATMDDFVRISIESDGLDAAAE